MASKAIVKCRKRNRCVQMSKVLEQNRALAQENTELKVQVDILRRDLYGKKKKQKKEPSLPKKKGAPVGHPGVTRAKPTHIDKEIEVIPDCCPHCGGTELTYVDTEEHIQEDIQLPKRVVTKYIKRVCKCARCSRIIRKLGPDEIPNAYIGPNAKALANQLRYAIGIPQDKIRQIFTYFDLPFVQSSVPGFENQLTRRGVKVYDEIKNALGNQKLLHSDNTGWKLNGKLQWLSCYGNKMLMYYHIDPSQGRKVFVAIIGTHFNGILITDFFSIYNKIDSIKQRCLVHLLRLIDRHQVSIPEVESFCSALKELTKEIIHAFKERTHIKDYILYRADLLGRVRRLLSEPIPHGKTDKFRRRLENQQEELTACLFHPKSDFNNNFAKRMLRPSVIMRKITFGNRSEKGIKNHAVIMSLLQTAQLHNKSPFVLFRQLFTAPKTVDLPALIRSP